MPSELNSEGSESFAQGSESNSKGTECSAQGMELNSEGTECPAQGTELDSKGTECSAQGTELDSKGTECPAQGMELTVMGVGGQLTGLAGVTAAQQSTMADTNVFISSTCEDLIDLRHELAAHVTALGLDPVMSDVPDASFTVAPSADTVANCLTNVAKCGHMILVLSQRYGWVDDATKKSITQLEYEEAIGKGIPVHVFIRDRLWTDLKLWEGGTPMRQLKWVTRKNGAKLLKLIQAVMSQLGPGKECWRHTFASSVELRKLVARSLGLLVRQARLRQLEDSGQLPLVAMQFQAHWGAEKHAFHFHNVGKSAAFNVRAEFSKGHVGALEVGNLLPDGVQTKYSPWYLSNPPSTGDVWIGIRYSTIWGLEFVDHYSLRGNPTNGENVSVIDYHGKSLESQISDVVTGPTEDGQHRVMPAGSVPRTSIRSMPPAGRNSMA